MHRDEHLALSIRQLADRGRQRIELLAPLDPLAGLRAQRVGQLLERKLLSGLEAAGARRGARPCRDLEHHELVRPGREPAEPAKVVKPRQDVHQRVVGSLLGEIIELRAADRTQLTAPPRQLVERRPPQQIVESVHRALPARVSGTQLRDPPLGLAIPRRVDDLAAGRSSLNAHVNLDPGRRLARKPMHS